jgi:UDP-N-acetylglucosamine 2-epimerase (non-hydrolysing)
MEAGNRCYDDRVPEEVNRRIIDHSSDVLLPYTERSRSNLLREGLPNDRIYVTGNPIREVLDHYSSQIDKSSALKNLNVEAKKYFLITLHRAENVDVPKRLSSFLDAFNLLYKEYSLPLICSLHPRTRSQLLKQGKDMQKIRVITVDPLGLFDFVHLEKNALCVLTDSGTVQEECCLFRVPTVTLRDVTERPETIEVGSNMLSGSASNSILSCVKTVLNHSSNWNPPPEYLVKNVSNIIVKVLLGYKWK